MTMAMAVFFSYSFTILPDFISTGYNRYKFYIISNKKYFLCYQSGFCRWMQAFSSKAAAFYCLL